MTKVAVINDIHFSVRSDSIIFLDYYEKFFNDIFFPEIIKRNIDTLIIAGDTFDRRKYINFLSLKRAKTMFFDKLQELNIKVLTIYGNHDLYFRNTNDVSSLDLLLREYKNIKIIDQPKTIKIKGENISFIPWIHDQNYDDCIEEINTSKAKICIGHFVISGFLMHPDAPVVANGMNRDIFDRFDMVLSGHFHHKSSDGKIHYLGNPFETTWSDFEDPKGFHILDVETQELEFIQNPYKMFYKLVYDDKTGYHNNYNLSDFKGTSVKVVVLERSNQAFFDQFIEKLSHIGPFDITIIENYMELTEDEISIDALDQTQTTTGMVNNYIDNLKNIPVDKNKLKTILKEIYTEALNTEEEDE